MKGYNYPQYNRAYYQRNKTHLSELNKQNQKANPERTRACGRRHYWKHREDILAINHSIEGRARATAIAKDWRARVKKEVLGHYSGNQLECFICKERRFDCLTIDHIEGAGNKHRRELGITGGIQFYSWLKRNSFPKGFRVLCMNCQFIETKNRRL